MLSESELYLDGDEETCAISPAKPTIENGQGVHYTCNQGIYVILHDTR